MIKKIKIKIFLFKSLSKNIKKINIKIFLNYHVLKKLIILIN